MKPAFAIHWLLLAAAANATQPTAVITGPTSAPAPGVIVLSSAGSKYDVGDLIWVWAGDQIQGMEGKDGRLALFYMGNQPVITSVKLLAVGAGPGSTLLTNTATATVSFGTPGPLPPPPDPPKPQPLPDGRYKLAQFTYDVVMRSVAIGPRSRAAALAAAYDATAATAASVSDVATFLDTTRKNNQAALGSDLAAWEAARVAMMAQVSALNLKTVPDMAVAWQEISLGLKSIPTK